VIGTAFVALVGVTATSWLAREARRYAVLDRVPRRRRRAIRLPRRVRAHMTTHLDAAAIPLAPESALQAWMALSLAGGVLGLGLGVPVAIGVVLAAVIGAPAGILVRARQRDRRIAVAVPDLVEAVAAELRAGGTVMTALARQRHVVTPLTPDLARLDARLQLGFPLADALDGWRGERKLPGVAIAAGAFAMATAVGGRAATALDHLAGSLRDRLGLIAETRALSAQARASALVVGLGPIGYLAWSLVVDRQAATTLVGTSAGRFCLALGLALEVVGVLWMRRILARGVRL